MRRTSHLTSTAFDKTRHMRDSSISLAFGPFTLDLRSRQLLRDGRPIELGARAVDVLATLIEADGELVTKDMLMDRVWPGITVGENNLQVQVSALRKALGEERELIQTVPGRGYRFAGVLRATGLSPAPEAEALPRCGRLSVMVLPFANLNEDPSLDYFVDGVTDSLITDLSRVLPGSYVISRSTAFTFKGVALDTRRIGKELGVRYVLAGSIMLTGDQVRVNAQLIDAKTDTHLWAERFDKPRADVLTVQDEIVARLARSVRGEMLRSAANTPAPDTGRRRPTSCCGRARSPTAGWMPRPATRRSRSSARRLRSSPAICRRRSGSPRCWSTRWSISTAPTAMWRSPRRTRWSSAPWPPTPPSSTP
jgi:TolB-like protein